MIKKSRKEARVSVSSASGRAARREAVLGLGLGLVGLFVTGFGLLAQNQTASDIGALGVGVTTVVTAGIVGRDKFREGARVDAEAVREATREFGRAVGARYVATPTPNSPNAGKSRDADVFIALMGDSTLKNPGPDESAEEIAARREITRLELEKQFSEKLGLSVRVVDVATAGSHLGDVNRQYAELMRRMDARYPGRVIDLAILASGEQNILQQIPYDFNNDLRSTINGFTNPTVYPERRSPEGGTYTIVVEPRRFERIDKRGGAEIAEGVEPTLHGWATTFNGRLADFVHDYREAEPDRAGNLTLLKTERGVDYYPNHTLVTPIVDQNRLVDDLVATGVAALTPRLPEIRTRRRKQLAAERGQTRAPVRARTIVPGPATHRALDAAKRRGTTPKS